MQRFHGFPSKKLAHEGEKLRKKIFENKKQSCFFPSCSDDSVYCHILQKNGGFRHIARNGKVVMPSDCRPFQDGMKFKEIGISQKISDGTGFYLFCNKHDHDLFAPIEKDNFESIIDLYKSQLLLSYRGFLSEYRKVQNNIEWFEEILKLDDIDKSLWNKKKVKFEFIFKDLDFYKGFLENDLLKDSESFSFVTRKINKIPLITSSCFPLIDSPISSSRFHGWIGSYGEPVCIPPLVLLNIIPFKDYTVVSFAFLNEELSRYSGWNDKFKNMEEDELVMFIYHIICQYVESWFCAPDFYEILKPIEKELTQNMFLNFHQ